MKFKDEVDVGRDCPKCNKPLFFEMSFTDEFSHKTGHYTIDRPLIICQNCDYFEDYEYEEEEY